MKKVSLVCVFLLIAGAAAFAGEPVPVTHWQFQAVYPDGSSSFDDNGPWQVVLTGILLNNPEEYLDPTPDPTIAPGSWAGGGKYGYRGKEPTTQGRPAGWDRITATDPVTLETIIPISSGCLKSAG